MDLSDLNPAQASAVKALRKGSVVVIAGAGSGKTRVLTTATADVYDHGVPARRVLLLTFTNRAAKEMKYRAQDIIGEPVHIWASTFHSFGWRVLRQRGKSVGISARSSIMDADDAGNTLKGLRKDMFGQNDKLPGLGDIADMFSAAVALQQDLDEVIANAGQAHLTAEITALHNAYTKFKERHNLLDFDDLLLKLYQLLCDEKNGAFLRDQFRYVLVDEYQDTNHLQALILYKLINEHCRFLVVGDDAQTIYTWRHARHTNLFELTQKYPQAKLVKLEQNYRSDQPILDLANALQTQMEQQFRKHLFTKRNKGSAPRLRAFSDDRAEANYLADAIESLEQRGKRLGNVAVLYRTNRTPTFLELELRRRRIPYRKYGGRSFNEAAHIKDLVAHLKVIVNPQDVQSSFRLLKLVEGVGQKTAERIISAAPGPMHQRLFAYSDAPSPPLDALRNVMQRLAFIRQPADAVRVLTDYYLKLHAVDKRISDASASSNREFKIKTDCDMLGDIATNYKSIRKLCADLTLDTDSDKEDEEDKVTLTTVHSAKGLEWPVVFVMGAFDGRIPLDSDRQQTDLEEELRILYVAVTRPKFRLTLTMPGQAMVRREWQDCYPSRFLVEALRHNPDLLRVDENVPMPPMEPLTE